MMKCGGCGKFISTQDGIQCTKCPLFYHRACVNIPDKAHISSTWACPNCKASNPRDNKAGTNVRGMSAHYADDKESPVIEKIIYNSTNNTQRTTSPCPETIDQILEIVKELRAEIRTLNNNENILKAEIVYLKSNLHETSLKLEKLSSIESEIKSLRAEISNNNGDLSTTYQTAPVISRNQSTLTDTYSDKIKVNKTSHQDNINNETVYQTTIAERPFIVSQSSKTESNTKKVMTPNNFSTAEPCPNEQINNMPTENWTTVMKKPHRGEMICGIGEIDNDLQAVENFRSIHLWSLKEDTTADNVKDYMVKKNPTGEQHYGVEKLKLKHNNYASFKLMVPETKFEFFMLGKNWPKNTKINEWFRKRTNKFLLGENKTAVFTPQL